MVNDTLIQIIQDLDSWRRKLLQISGTYYISLPKELVRASRKGKGDTIQLRRCIDECSGKVILVLNL